MTKKLIAFKGKQSVKDKYVGRVKAHAEADEIIKEHYWKDGKVLDQKFQLGVLGKGVGYHRDTARA